ncbi:MAG: dTMP kinase [bacterium]|nr:dTMP kinase [bacterium]MDZ4231605.1 dTMP kinase [Patescibacteria group bacterium]
MFICYEGIAGGGKTTQAKMLADYLSKVKKREVFVNAVYEGTRRKLVSDFMNESGIKSDQNAVMFLFQALHAIQYQEVRQALDLGKTVIADRWRHSFFAHHLYQNTFDGNEKLMQELDILAYRTLEPDILFLIDIPAEVAYDRYIQRESDAGDNGLEVMSLEYFTSVTKYYKQLAEDKDYQIVDGTADPEAVFQEIKKVIDKEL